MITFILGIVLGAFLTAFLGVPAFRKRITDLLGQASKYRLSVNTETFVKQYESDRKHFTSIKDLSADELLVLKFLADGQSYPYSIGRATKIEDPARLYGVLGALAKLGLIERLEAQREILPGQRRDIYRIMPAGADMIKGN